MPRTMGPPFGAFHNHSFSGDLRLFEVVHWCVVLGEAMSKTILIGFLSIQVLCHAPQSPILIVQLVLVQGAFEPVRFLLRRTLYAACLADSRRIFSLCFGVC